MFLRALTLLALVTTLVPASAGWALEKCKARINKNTSEIEVNARNVVGTPLWGGQETPANPFPDLASCLKGGKLKKCLLGESESSLAKRAPASCVLTLSDDMDNCQVNIQGCVAAPILAAEVNDGVVQGYWTIQRGHGALSVQKGATGEFHVRFERTVDRCFPTVTNVNGSFATACAHCGATNQHVRV
jgi:hypothetical protein